MLLFIASVLSVKICGKVRHDKKNYIVVEHCKNESCDKVRITGADDVQFAGKTETYNTKAIDRSNNYTLVEIPETMNNQYIRVEVTDNQKKNIASNPVNYGEMPKQSIETFFENIIYGEQAPNVRNQNHKKTSSSHKSQNGGQKYSNRSSKNGKEHYSSSKNGSKSQDSYDKSNGTNGKDYYSTYIAGTDYQQKYEKSNGKNGKGLYAEKPNDYPDMYNKMKSNADKSMSGKSTPKYDEKGFLINDMSSGKQKGDSQQDGMTLNERLGSQEDYYEKYIVNGDQSQDGQMSGGDMQGEDEEDGEETTKDKTDTEEESDNGVFEIGVGAVLLVGLFSLL